MKILDALLLLKEQAVNGCVNEPRGGICYNLAVITEELDLCYSFIVENCSDWEHFSGFTSYPVDGEEDEPLWEGKQLELRLSLLDHLIVKAKLLEGF